MFFPTTAREIDTQPFFLEDIQAPLSDVLTATAKRSFRFSPINSIQRSLELEAAGDDVAPLLTEPGPLGGRAPRRPREDVTPGRTLQPDEATELGKDLGLRFDAPVTERQFEILAERKREERLLNSIIARAPSGVLPAIAGVATDIAVQAIDPVNVASAFIPVVRETRLARIAERLGTSSRRVFTGAAEGAVGAAVVEPIILIAATQEQADYTAADSLLNVAFGAIIGSGLHFAGGKIGDAFEAAAQRRRARLDALVSPEDLPARDTTPDLPEGSNGHRFEALDLEQKERIAQAAVRAAQADKMPPIDRLFEVLAPSDVLETFTPKLVELSTTLTPAEFDAAVARPQIRAALTTHFRGLIRKANRGVDVTVDQEVEKLFELMRKLRPELKGANLRTPDNIRKLSAIRKNQTGIESVTNSSFFDPVRKDLFIAKNASLIDAVRAIEHATDLLAGKTDTASTTTFRFAPDDTEGRFLHRQIVNTAEAVRRAQDPDVIDGDEFVRSVKDTATSITADETVSEAATVRSAELNAQNLEQTTQETLDALNETIDGVRLSNPDLAGELDTIAKDLETQIQTIDQRQRVIEELPAYAECLAR